MPRVLSPLPGDVDRFTVTPDGGVYVLREHAPAGQLHLATAPALHAALWEHAGAPAEHHGRAVELWVTHGFPPRIEWSWRGADGPREVAPDSVTSTFLMWLARAVMADAAAAVRR